MSMQDHVRNYSVKYDLKIKKICSQLEANLGISYFTYFSIGADGRYSVIYGNAKVGEFIASEKLYLHNPFLAHPDKCPYGAFLWDSLKNAKYEERVLRPTQENFDIAHGLGMCKPAMDERFSRDYFGFAAPASRISVMNVYLNDMELLNRFCSYFKSEAQKILEKIHDDPIDLIELKGKAFFEAKPLDIKLHGPDRRRLEPIWISR